VISRVKLHWG